MALMGAPQCGKKPSREREKEPDKSIVSRITQSSVGSEADLVRFHEPHEE